MSALWMSTLTEAAVRTTALLAVAAIVALVLRRRDAATRHLVWAIALGGALVLPLAGAVLPGVSVPVPRVVADALPVPAANANGALPALDVAPLASLATVPGIGPDSFAPPAVGNNRGEAPRSPVPVAERSPATHEPAGAVTAMPLGTRLSGGWNPTLLALWGFAAAGLGAWSLASVWSTRRLAREATPVTSREWLETLRDAIEDLSIRRPVRLLQSDRAVMPMT